jgi:two-component system response regulator NreC
MLSMHADEAYVMRALQAGATGYVVKDAAGKELLTAIEAVAAGRRFFSPAIEKLLQDENGRASSSGFADRYETLSTREREIFQLIAEARSNKEVAALLDISPATVETHRARILQKLDVHNIAEVVLYAVRRGIIS